MSRHIFQTIAIALLCSSLSTSLMAEEKTGLKKWISGLSEMKYSRFLNLGKAEQEAPKQSFTVGQTKIAGEEIPSFVFRKGETTWGFNNRGISFNKRF